MSILVVLLLSFSTIECLSFSTRSPMLRSISCRPNMLDATISSSTHSRSIMRVATALQHSTGNNDDKPYLQHVCPSCSYVYDESKGFKKRHPPGKIYAFSCRFCNKSWHSSYLRRIWSSTTVTEKHLFAGLNFSSVPIFRWSLSSQICLHRIPPLKWYNRFYYVGTRLEDIPVFMCPVCGAAKDQFVVVVPQPE